MALFLMEHVSPLYPLLFLLLSGVTLLLVKRRNDGLKHIPGPWLAKYTDAWRCWQAYRLNHFYQRENYQIRLLGKYGDAVRIGPNTVLVLDPEAIPTVFGFRERLEKVR